MRHALLCLALLALAAPAAAAPLGFLLERVQPKAGQGGEYLWLAFGPGGEPHLSYYHRDRGDLHYAVRIGGSWNIETVHDGPDGAGYGLYSFLLLDASGTPHIVYHSLTGGDLWYATKPGASWERTRVDGADGSTVGRYANLRITPDGRKHILYHDEIAGDLRHAIHDGSGWSVAKVDTTGVVGIKARMILDAAGRLHAAWYDQTHGDLRYGRYEAGQWQLETADTGGGADVGSYASLAMGRDGLLRIAHWNADANEPRLTRQLAGGGWTSSDVEPDGDPGGLYGQFTSLQLDPLDRPLLAWMRWQQDNASLHYAGPAPVGLQPSQVVATGDVGYHAALVLGADRVPYIAYYDNGSDSLWLATGQRATPVPGRSFGAFRARP